MVKSLLGFGGGVESTALAYETLRDTDNEVILLNLDESRHYSSNPPESRRPQIEKDSTKACAEWLSANVRAISEVRYGDLVVLGKPAGTDLEKPDFQPCRTGYTQTSDAYVCWGKEKLHTLAHYAELWECDEVLTGMCLWDTDNDLQERVWVPYYEAQTSIPLRHRGYYTAHEDGTYSGVGRFELQSRIPAALWALTVRCPSTPACGTCQRCKLNAYYDTHCAGKTTEEIRAVDDALHRKYFLGPYVNTADPATYSMWKKYEL